MDHAARNPDAGGTDAPVAATLARPVDTGRFCLVASAIAVAVVAIAFANAVAEVASMAEQERAGTLAEANMLAAQARASIDAADGLLRAVEARVGGTTGAPDRLIDGATDRLAAHVPAVALFDRTGTRVAGDRSIAVNARGMSEALAAGAGAVATIAAGPSAGAPQVWRAIHVRDALYGIAVVQMDAVALGRLAGPSAARGGAIEWRSAGGRVVAAWPAHGARDPGADRAGIAPVEGYPLQVVVQPSRATGAGPWWSSPARAALAGALTAGAAIALAVALCLARRRREREAGSHREAIEKATRKRAEMALLLAGMSQQLRTPLNAVTGLVSTLQRMAIPEEPARILNEVALSSVMLRSVADDLLDVAAIESRQARTELEPMNLRNFVEDVVATARTCGRGDRILLDREVASDVPIFVLADRSRLARVLTHLLQNALRFTSRGAVSLSVRSVGGEPERPVVSFAVVDTGWGMPKEVRDRLARPGGDAARPADAGLEICRRLATHLGGELSAMSVDGLGSSVVLILPMRVVASDHGQAPSAAPAANGRRSLRILVAEDVPGSRMVARCALENLGHEVVVAADGADALEAFGASRFDAVIMDVRMPVLDGLEATRRLRASGLPGADRIPIIGLSAGASDAEVEAAIASGMDAHLAKPVTVADLEAALAGIVPQQEPPSAASGSMPASVPDPASAARNTALDELLRDLGADTMLVAVRQFGSDVGEFLSRLSAAQAAGDRSAVQKAAHGLKGLFRQFGVPSLAQVAATLDRNPAAGSPETADAVRHLVEDAPAALSAVLAQADAMVRPAASGSTRGEAP